MSFKVAQLVKTTFMPDYGQVFKEAGVDIEVVIKMCRTEEEVISTARDADGLLVAAALNVLSARVLRALPKCRFIQSIGVGYDGIDVAAATEQGIMVANIPHFNAEEVSDHTMALILACTRKIVALHEATKAGKWDSKFPLYILRNIWPDLARLRGQTLGLVGFGTIPQALVPKAKAFGIHLITYDPYASKSLCDSFGVDKVEHLGQLLAESDIVSLHTPLNEQTKGMMGMAQFEQMKRKAYLINTARGPVVDTQALHQALVKGLLAGAALDVTEPEPINIDNPLLKLDNVIITAHSAGASRQAIFDGCKVAGEEMINVLIKKQWPFGLVNPQVKEKYQEKWGR
ncbi:MAG: C-terminal binding protein [Dehalococcoidia bacterium]|nr:C-terminal binding protein [Dehalococcoidia bacterium]